MLAFRHSRWCTPDSDWEVRSVTPPKAPLHRTTPTNGLQRGDWPPRVNADFEQHYQAAERAYGLGEYAEAHALTSALWVQLESASNEHDPGLILGWRAVVSLLLGHVQLHGLQQADEAASAYQRVLDCEPDATIAALAEQGLERCRAGVIASEADTRPSTNGTIPDLLKDPFLSTHPDQARPAPADAITAMPWLSSDEEPRAMPTADPTPAPLPSPETTVTPAADSDIQLTDLEINPTTEESSEGNVETITPSPKPTLTPEASSEVEMANQEQAFSEEEPPLDTIEPAPREPAAPSLLEHSWLRVQLQPEIKSPTDSREPMRLINRIKGVFARSAGR